MNYNPYAAPSAQPQAQQHLQGGGYGGGPVPVGVVLSQSWELLKSNAGVAVGATFLVGFLLAIPLAGPLIAVQWYYFSDAFSAAMESGRSGGQLVFVLPADYYMVQPLLTLWMVAAGQIFGPGYARLYVAIARDQSPGVGVLFSGFGRVPASIGWALLTSAPGLLVQGLLALLALGGAGPQVLQALGSLSGFAALPVLLFQALGLIYTTWFIADAKLGPIQAAKVAWRASSRCRSETFLLLLALFVVNMLGACACGLGLFVTLPWSMIAIAYAYNNLPKEPPAHA